MQFTTLQPWLRPDRCEDPPSTFETTSCCVAVRVRTGHAPVTFRSIKAFIWLLLPTELPDLSELALVWGSTLSTALLNTEITI